MLAHGMQGSSRSPGLHKGQTPQATLLLPPRVSSAPITTTLLPSLTHHHLLINLDNLISWQDLGDGGSLV